MAKEKKITIKILKEVPKFRSPHKPTKAFKDKTKYTRKDKHKVRLEDE